MNFEFQLFEYENSVFAFYQEFFVIVMLFYMQMNESINIYKNGRCNVVLHLCIDKEISNIQQWELFNFQNKMQTFYWNSNVISHKLWVLAAWFPLQSFHSKIGILVMCIADAVNSISNEIKSGCWKCVEIALFSRIGSIERILSV